MATEVETVQHDWVAISIEPVTVLLDADGDPVIFSDPDTPPETQYGCNVCSTPLMGNVGTSCEGAEE